MWFTAPDNTFRMSSFRTKKWKRKYAVDKGNKGETGKDGARPANNWEFMAFNNFWMRGDSPDEPDTPRGSPAISPPGSRPNSRPPSWLVQFTIDENEELPNDSGLNEFILFVARINSWDFIHRLGIIYFRICSIRCQ